MNNKVWLQSFIQVPPFPLYHEPFSKWKKVILKLSWNIPYLSNWNSLSIYCQYFKVYVGGQKCQVSSFKVFGFSSTSQVKTYSNLLKSYPLILSSKSFLRKHSESFETWRFWTSAGTTLLLFLGVSIFF